MGSPIPLVSPGIVLVPPVSIINNKLKKLKIPYVPFTYIPSTDLQTDTQMLQHV